MFIFSINKSSNGRSLVLSQRTFSIELNTFNPLTKINTSAGVKGGNHRHDGENLQPLHTNGGIVKKVGRRTNVWDVACGSMNSKDKISFKHPATFPEKLAKDHIVSWTNEGDLVYDCFMGSGTTAKMCIENNRNYIYLHLFPC